MHAAARFWLQQVSRSLPRTGRRRWPSWRPLLESLEDRTLLANHITIAAGGSGAIPAGATTFADTGDYTIAPSALNGATTTINLRANFTITFTSAVTIGSTAANLDAEALQSIAVNAGISSPANITLLANQGTIPAAGDFSGIDVNGATVQTSGTGSIFLQGHGGGDSTTGHHLGVSVRNGGTVQSSGTGSVTLQGTGGLGTDENDGVIIQNSGSLVTSQTGAITVTGTAGTGSGDLNIGVRVLSGGQVSSTGTGAGSATITLTGTGGNAGNDNYGVDVEGANSLVTSVTGAIALTGTGGNGSGVRNMGTRVLNGGQVTSTGTGPGAATISIAGTGGSGAGTSIGVNVEGAGALVTSVAGAIKVTGTGGNSSGADNIGVSVDAGGQVTSTGTGPGAAPITFTGTGGAGTDDNIGVEVFDDAVVTSAVGAIHITGSGGAGSGDRNMGVRVTSGGQVTSTGTAPGAATITLQGTGVSGHANVAGVFVDGTGSLVTSAVGAIVIAGSGGSGTGISNIGVTVANGGQVTSTGNGPNAATITLQGTGGSGVSSEGGVAVFGTGALVTSVAGAITITGSGGSGSGNVNLGVIVANGGQVTSTGTGPGAAPITLQGTGGSGTGGANGVDLETSASAVTSQGGAISLTGARGSGPGNAIVVSSATVSVLGAGTLTLSAAQDVLVQNGASLSTADGALNILANQGSTPAAGNFIGIHVNDATVQTTGAGSILLQGRGGADTSTGSHDGVLLEANATVQATGSGSVTLAGTGGQGTDSDFGVSVQGAATLVTASSAVTLTGTGGSGSSLFNAGINVASGATVSTTGSGLLTLTGTGGSGPVDPTDTAVFGNFGAYIAGAATVEATGSGSIQITGTGGAGTRANIGLYIPDPATLVTARTAVTLTGTGGSGPGDFNAGIMVVSGATISATGSVTGTGFLSLTGTASGGTADNLGVDVEGNVTATNALTITGTGGTGSSSFNPGVDIINSAHVSVTGNGPLTITGTGGTGSDSDFGVLIFGTGTQVTAQAGGIQITGSAPVASGAAIKVTSGAVVSTTGSGTLTLNAAQDVDISAGASLSTVNGALTVLANQGSTPASGNFIGINISSATVQTTGAGSVLLQGRGGNDPSTPGHDGVQVNGAVIKATGSGSITLAGTGGLGAYNDYGVHIQSTGVTVVAGGLTLSGTAGTSPGSSNIGVDITDSTVSSTGTAPGALPLQITGTGGTGTANNFGVNITGFSTVQAAGAPLQITGTGGTGTDAFNIGVRLFAFALVTSAAGAVTITGTGGSGTLGNFGVEIGVANATVSSITGPIHITGTGGTGSADSNIGIYLHDTGQVHSSGTGAIVLLGQGGAGTSNNFGVELLDNAMVVSAAGSLTLQGTGGQGTSTGNTGVQISSMSQLQATGTAALSITGSGGTGTGSDYGVNITDTGTQVTAQDGGLQINGSANVAGGVAIQVTSSAAVSTTGNGTLTLNAAQDVAITAGASLSTTNGALTILANQGSTPISGNFIGINVSGATVQSTGAGSLLLQGRGGNDASSGFHIGVQIHGGGTVQSTGTGTITVTGSGGQGTLAGYGVGLQDSGSLVTSVSGAIAITGTGGTGPGGNNYGVLVFNAPGVTSTGTGLAGAPITLAGVGGQGGSINHGVDIQLAAITAAGGAILITGSAGPGGNALVVNSATLSNSAAGSITLSAAQDVLVVNATSVTTADGALTLLANQGLTPASGNFNGITIASATVQTTGAGNLVLQGRGGNDLSSSGHDGVQVQNAALVQASGTGQLTITGTAGQSNQAGAGVGILSASTVRCAVGDLTLTGTGSSGDGVFVQAGTVTALAGNVNMNGTGGNDPSSLGMVGVQLWNGAIVQAAGTGQVSITGTGGRGNTTVTGVSFNLGVDIENPQTLVTAVSAVSITGIGGSGPGSEDGGILVTGGAQVTSTGTGTITITGTGGQGTSANDGVSLQGAGTMITAANTVTIAGVSGTASTALLLGASAKVGTTGAPITLTGDSMSFDPTASISAPGSITTLQPLTPATQINLGGANAPGVLGLTAVELNVVNAGALHVGSGMTGNIIISASVALTPTSTLALLTGGTITEIGSLNVPNLRISATGPVALTGGNTVGTLAGQGASAFAFTDTSALTIGTVEGVAGIADTGANVDLTAAGITESAGISAAGLRLQGTGTFALTSANAVSTLAGSVTGPVTFTAPGPLAVGLLLGTPGLASGGGDITLAVTSSSLTVAGPIQGGTVDLTIAGALIDVGGSAISGTALAIHSATAVGAVAAPLVTTVSTLAITAGSALVANTGDLTISSVHSVNGLTATGAVTVAASGALTLPAGVTVQASNVTLSGGTAGTGASLSIAGTVIGSPVNINGGAGNDTFAINPGPGSSAMTVNGGDGGDTFNVTPTSTALTLHGGNPTTSPGDTLFVNLAGTTNPQLQLLNPLPANGLAGTWTFTGLPAITFDGMEALRPAADLAVTVTLPSTASEGGKLTYQVKITNLGPDSAQSVSVTDLLPAGVTNPATTFSGATITATTITIALGTLAAGQSISGTISFVAPAVGSLTNTVSATSPTTFDPTPGNNSQTTQTTVSDVAPVAGTLTGPSTGVRSQVLTFSVPFTDAGIFDTHTAVINWGDGTQSSGTLSEANGNGTVTGQHAYANTGTYTITVTIKDNFGLAAAPVSTKVTIGAAAVQNGLLVIAGTTGADNIEVERYGSSSLIVEFHSSRQPDLTFPLAGLTGIVVYGNGGGDTISIAPQITLPSFLFAGPGGHAHLTGGGGPTVEVGGGPSDVLQGGSGPSILIGPGGDSLIGKSGQDLLIGGHTSFDGNLPALMTLLSEWSRKDETLAQKTAHLRGTSGGLNAGNYLIPSTTLFEDTAPDQIHGNQGMNLVFASLSDQVDDKLKTQTIRF